jgi:hypothetical protein
MNTATSNMFDVGTVRMEAFIDHHAEQINRPRAVPSVKMRHVRKTSSQWSAYDAPSVDESELSFRSDPCRYFLPFSHFFFFFSILSFWPFCARAAPYICFYSSCLGVHEDIDTDSILS